MVRQVSQMKILVYGKGWISTLFTNLCDDHTIVYGDRIDTNVGYDGLRHQINRIKPDRVVCMIGRTHGGGIHTIDYLEQDGKLRENVGDNLYAPILLAQVCRDLDIHMTYVGTGCIFTYDGDHRIFSESDPPNFYGSSYSVVKGYTDQLMGTYPNVLNLRIRMPISSINHPRNFISKIISYDRICSIPNSMTVMDDMLPIMKRMMEDSITGTYNFTNPGVISHNEILTMYRDIVDPSFTWKNFTIDEQRQVLAADRSNNELDTTKLEQYEPMVKPIHEAVMQCLMRWKP